MRTSRCNRCDVSHNMSLKSIVLFYMLMFVCGKRAAINKIAHKHTKSQRLNYRHTSVKSIYIRMKNSTVLNLLLKPHDAELCQSDAEGGEMNFEMSGTYQSW